MRQQWMWVVSFSLAAVALEWAGGCSKNLAPVVPTNLPPSVNPTATSTCVTAGTHDPSPVATIQVSDNHYAARLYSAGTLCGSGFNECQVYVNNLDSSPATLEVAVYDNTQRVAEGSVVLPAGDIGWRKIALGSFSLSCSDPVALAVHASGAFLTIGAAPGGATCDTDYGGQTGPLPATYPNPSFLSSSGSSGWCYEISLDNCGP